MATLNTLPFTDLVRNMVTAIQAGSSSLINLTIGSVLRAIVESIAGVTLWLQGLIVKVMALTRAATSSASDLDSWMADFDFYRLDASFATNSVTFSRYTATNQATVPVGQVVQTMDGTQKFTVYADSTNASYNATLNAYIVAAGTSSLTVPVQANVAGSGGNVLAGTITQISNGIQGIDTVTNASAFTNGEDAETDDAFRARFILYIAALSKATKTAIASAIANLEQGLTNQIKENELYNGTAQNGFFTVIVDDGTGSPSDSVITNAASAIEAVRPITVSYTVHAPTVLTANVSAVITSASGYDHNVVVGNVGTALQNAINAIPLGTSLPYTQVASIIYSVDGVSNATSILLNSATNDLTSTYKNKIIAGTMVIS